MSQWRFWQLPRVIKHIQPDLYCSCPSEDFGKLPRVIKTLLAIPPTIHAPVKILAIAEAVIKTYTTRLLLESCPSEVVWKWAILKGLTHRKVVSDVCLCMFCFIICILTDSVDLTWIYTVTYVKCFKNIQCQWSWWHGQFHVNKIVVWMKKEEEYPDPILPGSHWKCANILHHCVVWKF